MGTGTGVADARRVGTGVGADPVEYAGEGLGIAIPALPDGAGAGVGSRLGLCAGVLECPASDLEAP